MFQKIKLDFTEIETSMKKNVHVENRRFQTGTVGATILVHIVADDLS